MSLEPNSAKILHIRTMSGSEIVVAADDVRDVRSLKQHLQSKGEGSRFRMLLMHGDRLFKDDCSVLELPTDLQMVSLNFADTSEDQVGDLMEAAFLGSVAWLEELLQRPQDPNRTLPDPLGRPPLRRHTALGAAADGGNAKAVRILLEACADTEGCAASESDEVPALAQAAAQRHVQVVRILLEAGASTESKGILAGIRVTPLLAAIQSYRPQGPDEKSMEIVQLLLEARADPNFVGQAPRDVQHDSRPLVAACQGGHLEVARLLLEGSLRGDVLPPAARAHVAPALVVASSKGYLEIQRLLQESAPTVLEISTPQQMSHLDSFTPLLLAATWGHVGIVRLLLEAHADPHTVYGPDGLTALSEAAAGGHLETVRLLLGRQGLIP
ncbi:ANKRD17 [Symbiodinium pilosum]|uniref:ANKRD17 protein n=1 Tax=Symbiodinium pilosum TaxID=2952 RepID=A0A812WRW1_SYMPI|nr:ANKRD17 [Symbiodinium pilosum]